jgi:hypothetical protein
MDNHSKRQRVWEYRSAVPHALGPPTTMPSATLPAAQDTSLQDLDAERKLRVLRLLFGQLDEPLECQVKIRTHKYPCWV